MRDDVLIVGAGPSGLFATAELARHGVTARLIERDVRPHREARATAIQPGTLEILASVGALPPLLEAAEHVHCARLYGPNMAELGAMRQRVVDINALRALAPLPRAPVPRPSRPQPPRRPPAGAAGQQGEARQAVSGAGSLWGTVRAEQHSHSHVPF